MNHHRPFNSIFSSDGHQPSPDKSESRQNKFFRLGKDLFKFALLTAFFFAILALFNYGLSQLNQVENLQNSIPPTKSPSEMPPPPTVFPSGHAEVKMPASPRAKPTAEGKKKDK